MFIDSHCHLDFPEFNPDSPTAIDYLENMQSHDVDMAIAISVDLAEWQNVHKIALTHKNIFCSVGVHPDYPDCRDGEVDELVKLAKLPKVVAIGECGLDYHHQPDKPKWQEERFIKHLTAAKLVNKPLIIHSRDCGVRMIEILKSENASRVGGVMHCFTDTWEIAKAALDLGFYISFSGIVSFKNAKELHETAKKIPADKYLIETDAPYLSPTPHRGKINQPAYVKFVAMAIAQLRNISLEQVGEETTINTKRLFNFDLTK